MSDSGKSAKKIDLDAGGWLRTADIYDALFDALNAPMWHSKSIDALIDSIVWGGINGVSPPYQIEISNVERLPIEVREHLELIAAEIRRARLEYRLSKAGKDVDAEIILR